MPRTLRRALGLTSALLISTAGCGGDDPAIGPATPEASTASVSPGETPKAKVYNLYTHCGVEFAYYEGRYFKAAKARHGATRGSAPRGWGDPEQPGELVILDEEEHVQFRAPGLPTIDFYVTDEQPPPCD